MFHLLRKFPIGHFQKYFPNMKKRMWIGVLFLFLNELTSLIINNQIEYNTLACEFYNEEISNYAYQSSTAICYFSLIQFANNTELNTTDCVSYCSTSIFISDNTLLWLLVPQILHGFGYMLVFLTVLEFICAQAPFRLKGFMAGIWYAMLSVKFFITTIDIVIVYYHPMERTWIIYESIKIGMIGLSLIVFGITCRWYKYRERDEVVNVQGMIEDIFERELLQQQNEEESSDDEDTILISSQTHYHTFQK